MYSGHISKNCKSDRFSHKALHNALTDEIQWIFNTVLILAWVWVSILQHLIMYNKHLTQKIVPYWVSLPLICDLLVRSLIRWHSFFNSLLFCLWGLYLEDHRACTHRGLELARFFTWPHLIPILATATIHLAFVQANPMILGFFDGQMGEPRPPFFNNGKVSWIQPKVDFCGVCQVLVVHAC